MLNDSAREPMSLMPLGLPWQNVSYWGFLGSNFAATAKNDFEFMSTGLQKIRITAGKFRMVRLA